MEHQSLNSCDLCPTFSAGGRNYGVDHVLQAAEYRGDLDELFRKWSASWVVIEHALSQGAEPDEADLEQLAVDFRYARNLVTAEECERWLAGLGLDADEFSAHFVRSHLAGPSGLFAATRPSIEPAPAPVALNTDQARAFRIDLLLSKTFPSMAHALAWRVALQCEGGLEVDAAKVELQKARAAEIRHAAGARPENSLFQWEGAASWSDELPRLEALFQLRSESLLTSDNQQRAMASLRLPLVRFDLEFMELDSSAAAREAFLCATHDDVTLDELASQNRHPLRRMTAHLEDLPQDWQQALLGASPEMVLPPFAVADGFQLCRVVGKHDPSLTDPAVLTRVNASLLRTHFEELEHRHIRWQVNIEVEE